MSNVINESDMDFISDNAFHIEKSTLYANIGEGVKTVELVRAKDDRLLFIEAKTTFPNPNNPDSDSSERFIAEIRDILDKFVHSLNMFSAVEIGVLQDDEQESMILTKNVSLVFILVVKNHEFEWCKPIERELIAFLPRYFKRIWKPNVLVINHEEAINLELAIV